MTHSGSQHCTAELGTELGQKGWVSTEGSAQESPAEEPEVGHGVGLTEVYCTCWAIPIITLHTRLLSETLNPSPGCLPKEQHVPEQGWLRRLGWQQLQPTAKFGAKDPRPK